MQDSTDFNEGGTHTTVELRCTGNVRAVVGEGTLTFTFEGTTLRELLDEVFATYPIRELLIADTEADATAHGWAPTPRALPGSWRKNPEGEQTRRFARVTVNGRFNEHLNGLDTELTDGDRVGLLYPFMYCV